MVSLLPSQSSDIFELTLEASIEPRWAVLAEGADAVRGIKFDPPISFLPFLIYEYGLGELTPYISNLYTLIIQREGVNWQRLRGTPAAVSKGLGWISQSGTLQDAWHGRAFWNSAQLTLDALPSRDSPDLEQIEGITRLSLPLRSHLRRVVHGYDVGACEADRSFFDGCMLDRESGVVATNAETLWSFGRQTEMVHMLTEQEGLALGNWLAPVDDTGLMWASMQYPWVTATFQWANNPASQRRALMAAWFPQRAIYLTFKTVAGAVIGHRRARANRVVRESSEGLYSIEGNSYRPEAGGPNVYIEAMTDFGDASDIVAASIELTIGPTLSSGVKAGKLWLSPDELVGGSSLALGAVSLPLRKTVRDQVKILLRF
ncbi:phage tail protein [Neorhizobium sp. LMR1-1-1.1]